MQRGDIHFIHIHGAIGREMRKSRPGVIVSSGDHLDKADLVQVVLCSASNGHALETHVPLRSTPVPSLAMCEHIYTVDRSRIGKHMGQASQVEMEEIDRALALVLGLNAEIGGT